MHCFDIYLEGKNIIVLRSEAGVLREYRKQVNATKMIVHEALRCKLKNIDKEVMVLGCLVNPIMYYALAKLVYEIYPTCRRPLPLAVIKLMETLAEIFHLEQIKGENPFVQRVGWQVREKLDEHAAVVHSNKAEIDFFIQQNPCYHKGYGLEVVIPLTFTNLIVSFYNSIMFKLNPQWRCFKKTLINLQ